MTLDEAERRAFAEEGYLVVPGALTRAACAEINAHFSGLIARVAGEHARGERDYPGFWAALRRSAHALGVLLDPAAEPAALPVGAWEGATVRVGHGLHRADARLGALCRSGAIGGALAALVPEPGRLVQSALVYKQPRSEAAQFGFHQDSWYLTAEPDTLVLAFLALDDMDQENGCLEVIPGSHREGLATRLVLGDAGFVPLGRGRGFGGAAGLVPAKPPSVERGLPSAPRPERARRLEVEQGTLILAHGRTWHGSGPNRSERPRRALIVHAIGGGSRMQATSWIQPPEEGFTSVETYAAISSC